MILILLTKSDNYNDDDDDDNATCFFLQPGGLESILETTFHNSLVEKTFSLEVYLATVVVAGCWKGKM